MENIVEYLLIYLIALLLEIVAFLGFVYFVSKKTDADISRRWKASIVISVCFGVLLQLISLVIIVLGWFNEANLERLFISLPEKIMALFVLEIGIAAIITMPAIVIGLFVAYRYLWQTGDRLVEKYWKNPKIHYGENSKPPFLKF